MIRIHALPVLLEKLKATFPQESQADIAEQLLLIIERVVLEANAQVEASHGTLVAFCDDGGPGNLYSAVAGAAEGTGNAGTADTTTEEDACEQMQVERSESSKQTKFKRSHLCCGASDVPGEAFLATGALQQAHCEDHDTNHAIPHLRLQRHHG